MVQSMLRLVRLDLIVALVFDLSQQSSFCAHECIPKPIHPNRHDLHFILCVDFWGVRLYSLADHPRAGWIVRLLIDLVNNVAWSTYVIESAFSLSTKTQQGET